MEDDTQTITIPVKILSQQDEIRVVFDYFQGTDKKKIAKIYGIPVRSISTIVDKYKLVANRDILYKKFELDKARESDKIVNIKNKIYDLVEGSIDDLASTEDKSTIVESFTKIKDILGKMDEIFRLNNNLSTQNIDNKTTTTKIDVAEILKTLPTQEDKLRFLQGRSSYVNNN